jgi:hypothetical protein
VRLKHKAWFFGGAALGLAIPIAMRAYDVYEGLLMLDGVPPFVRWLFWPTSFFVEFRYPGLILALLIFFGNALLYGVLAGVLRRASIAIAALLVVVAWMAVPPSDTTLVNRFRKHRRDLEQLVKMANQDSEFAAIRPGLVKTVDGKEYKPHEIHKVLSDGRWGEYRRLFNTVGLNEGLNRDEKTGDVFLAAHTFGKTYSVASYFGFLYCSDATGRAYGFTPCVDGGDSADKHMQRWKKLDSGWYIFEVRIHGIE